MFLSWIWLISTLLQELAMTSNEHMLETWCDNSFTWYVIHCKYVFIFGNASFNDVLDFYEIHKTDIYLHAVYIKWACFV